MLQADVKGLCLHWPKNWLVRQQVDSWDGKVSTQVGFIRKKGKAAPRDGQRAQKIGSPLLFTWCGYLVLFVGEGSQESGVEWSFNISLQEHIQFCKSLLFVGLVAF
jgi:hypothetical protein